MVWIIHTKGKHDPGEFEGSNSDQTEGNKNLGIWIQSQLTKHHEDERANQHDNGLEGVCVNHRCQATCGNKERNQYLIYMLLCVCPESWLLLQSRCLIKHWHPKPLAARSESSHLGGWRQKVVSPKVLWGPESVQGQTGQLRLCNQKTKEENERAPGWLTSLTLSLRLGLILWPILTLNLYVGHAGLKLLAILLPQ